VANLVQKLVPATLVDDAKNVLHAQEPIRREVRSRDGRWFIVQIAPQCMSAERIAGVVITWVETTGLEQVEAEIAALHEELREQIFTHAKQMRALASALSRAEEWERKHIYEILHNHLQQLLYGLQMRVQMLYQEVPSESDPMHGQIGELRELLDEAIRATRTLTSELNPPVMAEENLQIIMQWLIEHMRNAYGLTVELTMPEKIHLSDQDTRMLVFQSMRELLLNVVKHAEVDRATLQITRADGYIVAQVADKGIGFVTDSAEGWGLVENGVGLSHIRKRLHLIGGRFKAESEIGEGTCITLHIPLFAEIRTENDVTTGDTPQ
jgi:signal transduction histidine kinase